MLDACCMGLTRKGIAEKPMRSVKLLITSYSPDLIVAFDFFICCGTIVHLHLLYGPKPPRETAYISTFLSTANVTTTPYRRYPHCLMSNKNNAFPLSLPSVLNNPAIGTAISLHRKHPGEMVFLEVAAAGALLYGHHKRKEQRDKYREEADENLRQRGWDSGVKARAESEQRSGMLSPPVQDPHLQRPTSAPPPGNAPQNWQGMGAQPRDDPLAYGYLPPLPQHYGPQQNNPLAYGSPPPEQYRPPNSAPPFQQFSLPYNPPPPQQFQQPYGPPPSQYPQPWSPPQYQQHPYGPPPPGSYPMQPPPPGQYGPPVYQQGMPPPGPY